MIAAIGVDAVELERIHGLWQRAGERFVQRICTAAEADYCRRRANRSAKVRHGRTRSPGR